MCYRTKGMGIFAKIMALRSGINVTKTTFAGTNCHKASGKSITAHLIRSRTG